jgi:hypothetical protein
MAVFWVVAPCSLVEVYRRSRGACCLHHYGDRPCTGLHGATTQKTAIWMWECSKFVETENLIQVYILHYIFMTGNVSYFRETVARCTCGLCLLNHAISITKTRRLYAMLAAYSDRISCTWRSVTVVLGTDSSSVTTGVWEVHFVRR